MELIKHNSNEKWNDCSYNNYFDKNKQNPPPHLTWAMERNNNKSVTRLFRMRYKNDLYIYTYYK